MSVLRKGVMLIHCDKHTKKPIPDLCCMLHIVALRVQTVVVSSRDTDVILLLVAHFRDIHCDNLWVMAGHQRLGNSFLLVPSVTVSQMFSGSPCVHRV